MDRFGNDFDSATGSVMTRAQLEDQRRKRGECVTCGRKCFQKKLFKTIPITDHGRVLNGRCLNCHPLNNADDSDAIPAVSRRATTEDLERFNMTQSNLALVSSTGHNNGNNNSVGVRPLSSRSASTRIPTSTRSYKRNTSTRSLPAAPAGTSPSTSRALMDTDEMSESSGPMVRSTTATPEYAGASSRSVPDYEVRSESFVNTTSNPRGPPRVMRHLSAPIGRCGPYTAEDRAYDLSDNDYAAVAELSSAASASAQNYRQSQLPVGGGEYALQQQSSHSRGSADEDSQYYIAQVPHHITSDTNTGSQRSIESMISEDARLFMEAQQNRVLNRGGAFTPQQLQSQLQSQQQQLQAQQQQLQYNVIRASGGGSQGSMSNAGRSSSRGVGETSSRSLESTHSTHSYDDSNSASQQQPRIIENHPEYIMDITSGSGGIRDDGGIGPPGSVLVNQPIDGLQPLPPDQEILIESSPGLLHLRNAGADFVEIINVMRDYSSDMHVQCAGLQLLAGIQLSDEDSDILAQIGGIGVIVESMMAFPSSLDVQVYGCGAIWNASGTSENQHDFVQQAGVLDILVQDLEQYIREATLQEQAMAALANLAALEINLDLMIEKGVLKRVVETMSTHAEKVSVLIKGCLVIANLSSHPTTLKKTMMDMGGGSALVISMVMHPTIPELQEKALRGLRNLSANCDENKIEITNIGGIDAVIGAMQVHRDEAGVQEAGAWTLSNLAGNSDSSVLIGECGGIDVIIRAMWVHSELVTVLEWCCRALFTLALDERNARLIMEIGGISAVINAMQAHVDGSSVVQEMGCAVLCNLASDLQCKMRIVEEEALDAIVLAMVLYSDDVRVQERACQVLLQLSVAENLRAMQASNVAELVQAASEKFPERCGEPAHRLLEGLEGYIAEYG